MRRARRCGLTQRAVTHLGLQPVYLSPAMLERGELRKRGIRLLMLPHAIALSARCGAGDS